MPLSSTIFNLPKPMEVKKQEKKKKNTDSKPVFNFYFYFIELIFQLDHLAFSFLTHFTPYSCKLQLETYFLYIFQFRILNTAFNKLFKSTKA